MQDWQVLRLIQNHPFFGDKNIDDLAQSQDPTNQDGFRYDLFSEGDFCRVTTTQLGSIASSEQLFLYSPPFELIDLGTNDHICNP